MAGFDYEAARKKLAIPPHYQVEAMIAVGRPGRIEDLDESLRERELPSDRRLVSEFAFEGSGTGVALRRWKQGKRFSDSRPALPTIPRTRIEM